MFGLRKDPATMLRTVMASNNVNVNELSDITGLSRRTITALRNDPDRKPTADTVRLISDALGVKPNSIWPYV